MTLVSSVVTAEEAANQASGDEWSRPSSCAFRAAVRFICRRTRMYIVSATETTTAVLTPRIRNHHSIRTAC